jgi:hypothetical protein
MNGSMQEMKRCEDSMKVNEGKMMGGGIKEGI